MLFSCDLVWDSVSTVFPLDKIHMKTTYHIYCVQYNQSYFTQNQYYLMILSIQTEEKTTTINMICYFHVILSGIQC